MKQQIVERARGIVETVLGKPYTGAAPDVMSVNPEVDSYGDGFFWTYLKYDDGNPKCLSDPSARLRLTDRLRTELLGAEVEAFPVVSFIVESEVEPDGRSGRLPRYGRQLADVAADVPCVGTPAGRDTLRECAVLVPGRDMGIRTDVRDDVE